VFRPSGPSLAQADQRELAAEGIARFLRLYRSGRGNYTKGQGQWLNGGRIDETDEQIRSAVHPGEAIRTLRPGFALPFHDAK
jgi:hypothetical protein